MPSFSDSGSLRLLLVAFGGALGAMARYGVYLALPLRAGEFPTATLLINTFGCLLIGILASWALRLGPAAATPLFLLGGMGFLGAFTTFSTFGLETLQLIQTGQTGWAAMNVIANCLLGVLAAFLGVMIFR